MSRDNRSASGHITGGWPHQDVKKTLSPPPYLVNIVLLLTTEAKNVESFVRKLHVLLVVNGVHLDLTLGDVVVIPTDK